MKENTGSQSKHPVNESQFASHSNRGIGHAGAVRVVDDVENEKEWKYSQATVVLRAVGELCHSRRDRG